MPLKYPVEGEEAAKNEHSEQARAPHTHELRDVICTFLYAKEQSAQPGVFWRTHHTKSDPQLMQAMPL